MLGLWRFWDLTTEGFELREVFEGIGVSGLWSFSGPPQVLCLPRLLVARVGVLAFLIWNVCDYVMFVLFHCFIVRCAPCWGAEGA